MAAFVFDSKQVLHLQLLQININSSSRAAGFTPVASAIQIAQSFWAADFNAPDWDSTIRCRQNWSECSQSQALLSKNVFELCTSLTRDNRLPKINHISHTQTHTHTCKHTGTYTYSHNHIERATLNCETQHSCYQKLIKKNEEEKEKETSMVTNQPFDDARLTFFSDYIA